MRFNFLKKKKLANRKRKNIKVFYICDKRACDGECSPKCTHTSNITHAKNFKCVGGNCYEETINAD